MNGRTWHASVTSTAVCRTDARNKLLCRVREGPRRLGEGRVASIGKRTEWTTAPIEWDNALRPVAAGSDHSILKL